VELPVARGELNNRTKTFLVNPLCRGVDELCTKQAEDFAVVYVELQRYRSEELEPFRNTDYVAEQCVVLCKENRALLAENEGLEGLVELAMAANDRNNGVIRQYQSALMYYNELQSRSAGVEEIHLKFEQKVADEGSRKGWIQAETGPEEGQYSKSRPEK
jgi:hypothetical protein